MAISGQIQITDRRLGPLVEFLKVHPSASLSVALKNGEVVMIFATAGAVTQFDVDFTLESLEFVGMLTQIPELKTSKVQLYVINSNGEVNQVLSITQWPNNQLHIHLTTS